VTAYRAVVSACASTYTFRMISPPRVIGALEATNYALSHPCSSSK
jgi:hypothetical protein